MPSTVYLRALGLNTSPNSLNVPDGSLLEASNVIIRRDNIIESRRGFKLYGDALPSSTDRAKQLMVYKNRIIRHFENTLQYDDGTGSFTSFNGSYSETEDGLRIKSIEANSNFYFTTASGIKKLSAKTASDFTSNAGFITNAGGVKAIDLESELVVELGNQTGFLTADSAVAYRVVWGITDANDNLILGSPSARSLLYNPLQNLIVKDIVNVLGALDDIASSATLIDDGNYLQTLIVDSSTSAADIRANLLDLTEKLDQDILYANDTGTGAPLNIDTANITGTTLTINFSSGTATDYLSPGSEIEIEGFTDSATDSLDGTYTVVTVGASSITMATTGATGAVTVDPAATIISNEYRSITQPVEPSSPATHLQLKELQTYVSNIIQRLQTEPDGVIPTATADTYITGLDITNTATARLTITIPEEVTENHFYQVYRSSVATAEGAAVLETDIVPNDEMRLVFEEFPTAAQLEAGTITVEDVTPDSFRGANLYTNPSTGEGITQSNDVPPFAKDINEFKNVVFYANTRTKFRKLADIIGVQQMIDDYNSGTTPTVTITSEDKTNTYRFVTGQQEVTEVETVAGGSLASSGTASYWQINSANDKDLYYIWYNIGTATDPNISGRTGIEVVAGAGDTDVEIAEKTFNQLSRFNDKFSISLASNTLTITNLQEGYTEDATVETSGFTITVTTDGRGERFLQEEYDITTVADVSSSLAGTYFTINNVDDQQEYYVWYRVDGAGSDPTVGNRTPIIVDIDQNDTAAAVATKTASKLNTDFPDTFVCESSGSTLNIKLNQLGDATNPTAGTSGFTVNVTQEGALEVLLSTSVSPAVAVDQTARSFIKAININDGETIYAFYLSGAFDVPGQILFEGRSLEDKQFFLSANNSNTGASFSPDISPELEISSITSSGSNALITTSSPHGLINLDKVIISGSNSDPIVDGLYEVTFVSSTSFTIAKPISSAGNSGGVTKTTRAEFAENEEKSNRIYYSKVSQPEAVPLVNFFDVGASNKEILRIFPLRDSLFVFKEDGLYRISGEVSPFNLALFDGSNQLIAADSLGLTNNTIYGWSTEGITAVTESGVSIISRPIDNEILKLSTAQFTNFDKVTWGLGYDSDNAYLVFTNKQTSDTSATICYRYDTLSNAWTTYDLGKTCGVINEADDKLYLGANDINYIEQERKDFERTDYADREFKTVFSSNNFFGNRIKLQDVSDYNVGDVLVQEQKLTIYEYNMLLKKLDADPSVGDTDYFSTLEAIPGDNIRTKIEQLATKLDADSGINDTDYSDVIGSKSGTITAISVANPTQITSVGHELETGRFVTISGSDSTPSIDGTYEVTVVDSDNFTINLEVTSPGTSGSFQTDDASFNDVKGAYNTIIDKLNLDTGVSFSNYSKVDTESTFEAVITNVNRAAKEITLDLNLQLLSGNISIFKGINSTYTYAPNTMGNALSLKHISEATMMFENKAFTSAIMSFSTDLLPEFIDVEFNGTGNGIFGHKDGFGDGFFGGASHSAPFRTYVPNQCQRCRFINVKFTHKIARENFKVFGTTLTGKEISTRAYR